MNDLLDEFDDDIDRIKSQAVPKSVKYSVFSFGFLVIFLIMWEQFLRLIQQFQLQEK